MCRGAAGLSAVSGRAGDADQLAAEFACLAALGTEGCGFEQHLEAALEALWPAGDDRVSFHGAGAPTTGHGDAANAGFSRAEPGTVPSLLVIVALADEDDCSAADLSMFLPAAFYRALLDDPRMQEEIDPQSAEVAGAGHLQPVCESETARAYPARRLVELARRFGENGTVQSICQPDFADVMRSVLERVAHRMRNPGNADSR